MNLLRKKLKILINSNIKLPDYSLPNEYQEVEYIASTANKTEYIDTDYFCSSNTDLYIKLYLPTQDTYTFGSTYTNKNYLMNMPNPGRPYWTYGSLARQRNFNISIGANTVAEVSIIKGTVSILSGAQTGTSQYDNSSEVFSAGERSLGLFAAHNASGGWSLPTANMRLYECKLWESDELSAWFTPCYHKTSGEIGLYDRVRRRFFTNAGTGTFTKGSDIN